MERGWQTLAFPLLQGGPFPPSPSHSLDILIHLCSCLVAPPFTILVILPWLSFYSFSDPLLYTSPTILVQFGISFLSPLPTHSTDMASLLFQCLCFEYTFLITLKSFPCLILLFFCILLFVCWSSHRLHMTHAPSTGSCTLMTQTP